MLLLVGYKETKEATELLQKIATNIGKPSHISYGTGAIYKIEKKPTLIITFGKAARNRVKLDKGKVPILELPSVSRLSKMNDEQKSEIWTQIEEFIKQDNELPDSQSEQQTLTLSSEDITISIERDIKWSEIESILSLCEMLGIKAGNLEIEK